MASSELAAQTGLPKPTVAKVLKILSRKEVVTATRGATGGYALSRPATEIDARQLIEAIEGPIAIAECVGDTPRNCCYAGDCSLEKTWRRINGVICAALESLSVRDMAKLDAENLVQLRRRLQGSPPASRNSATNDDANSGVTLANSEATDL